MNVSLPFIKKPIATTLLTCGLAIAGILAFRLLPVAPLPQIDFPTIAVQTSLPGASPEVMATSVATPLERQLGRIAGVNQLTSSSSLGQTNVIVQFDLTRDIDGAARDVQAAINAARSDLPINLPNNPTYRKVNPADAPILIMALTSDQYTTSQLYDLASTVLQQKILRLDGVGQVNLAGSSLPAVRVELNPTALNSYGIGLGEVATAVIAANVNQAKGLVTQTDGSQSILTTNDQLTRAEQYAPLIIRYQGNAPVRITDVATVVDSVADVRNAGLANGKPAVILVLFKQPGANVIKTVDQVKSLLPSLKDLMPKGVELNVLLDRTSSIRASLHDVELTLVIAMLLVILVTYLFLGSVSAMMIPGVTVPLSLLGTFAVMRLLDYSLDNLSLMALTISTGFVVDDAVVVLENISRHVALGKSRVQAAIDGAQEIGFTVISMSSSLIAVFIPILLMGGIVGRLFREFVITLSVAILISMLVSLTLTPMMCSKMLQNQHDLKENWVMRQLTRLKGRYERSLYWALTHASVALASTGATIVLTIILLAIIPKGFFPQQESDRITASLRADQNSSFTAMRKKLSDCVTLIKKDPDVLHVAAFIGGSGPGGSSANTGSLFISLKQNTEKKTPTSLIMTRLRKALTVIPGASIFMQSAQDLSIGGRSSGAQFQYTVTANHLQDLNFWTPKIVDQLASLSGISDVNSDQLNHGLQVYVEVSHDEASRFGITPEQIDSVLSLAFGQSQISTIYRPMNQYKVVLEVAPNYWQYPETLNEIYVQSAAGKEVPLSAFARFKPGFTLLSVNHQGQAPAATISFNLVPGTSLGDAVKQIEALVAKMQLPPDVRGSFQGTAQAFQESFANEVYLIIAALVAIYIVLGMLYESLIHPITILSTLPSAGLGALLALLLCRTELSIIAFIGIILLIGIVKKNAIMMIDFALEVQRLGNKTAQEAIFEAAVLRFRPILMTTMAALFGAIPLVIGFGVGSELRRPLGIAIVGGLVVSQLLTLYTTPVIFIALEKLRTRLPMLLRHRGLYGH